MMASSMEPIPQEPCVRRPTFVAMRTAAVELWGPGALRLLGERMPERARRETVKPTAIVPEWLPEIHLMAWYEAAWEGPCARRESEYFRFIDRTMDHGFGRVRKALLLVATPPMLGAKAGPLWRHDHTHGTLQAENTGARELTLTLSDNMQTTTEVSRLAIVEVYRYACTLTRYKEARAAYSMHGNQLVVRIQWR
jgi:hypothetical protein